MTPRENSPLQETTILNQRFIAVTGGKGGTGKSTIAVNLATAYAEQGERVLLIDGNLGMADLNLMLGVAPSHSILDLLYGEPLEKVLTSAFGVSLLPALNGSYQLANLEPATRQHLLSMLQDAYAHFDTVIIDTAAGLSETSIDFASTASDVVVVANASPLSLADAYACIKVLATYRGLSRAYVLPNAMHSQEEADEVFSRLVSLVGRFLPSFRLRQLPAVLFDATVNDAAASGIPFLYQRPGAPVSRSLRQVASRLSICPQPRERASFFQPSAYSVKKVQ